MNNLIRWGICQTFGKDKGIIIYNALFGGELGKAIKNADAIATQEAFNTLTGILTGGRIF